MTRIKISMPIKSLLPLGLGMASIWAFLTAYSLAGFLICPNWQPVIQAPNDTASIRTYYNHVIFIETQSGKILCTEPTSANWEECSLPSSPWERKEAPAWLTRQFKIIPDQQIPIHQVVKIIVFDTLYNFALSEDDQIWGCSNLYSENLDQIASSGVLLFLLIPAGTGLLSAAWWFKIYIEEGHPMIWDWWSGRGKPIK